MSQFEGKCPEDYMDHSHWFSYLDEHVRYFNNVVLQQMIIDIREELSERIIREHTKPQTEKDDEV